MDLRNKENEISIGKEKANIAVATSSPNEDFEFDKLPKVEDADIITPSYASGSVVKANEESYNIYDTIPDLMSKAKEEVKDSEVVKKEFTEFVETLPKRDEVKVISSKNEDKKEDTKSEVVEEKANVNIDADDVYIDSNVITDDQFFDDFFADD